MSKVHLLKHLLQRYVANDGRGDGDAPAPAESAGKTRDADGQQQSQPTNAPERHDDLYDAVIAKPNVGADELRRPSRTLQHHARRRR
jgi:hypothetical protein